VTVHYRVRDADSIATVVSRQAHAAAPDAAATSQPTRPRVVFLGSGWASTSAIKAMPANIRDSYEVVLLSPRNYFCFTPLLPAVAAGCIEERTVVEPVRRILGSKGQYYEAVCSAIDPAAKTLTACFPQEDGSCRDPFVLHFDMLVVATGSVSNTCGVPGVAEHCCSLKTLDDAHVLRRRISDCFERAALPHASEEHRRQLLSFVVCGGGPSGVEVAAELHDMVHDDMAKQFPELVPLVSISLVEMLDRVLDSYNVRAGAFAARQFQREGVQLMLNHRVKAVSETAVTLADKQGVESSVPCGVCVWTTGIAAHPLVKQLQEALPGAQTHSRCIEVDEFLRVRGSDGSIWALGDAAAIQPPRAAEHAAELFREADGNGDGFVSLGDLRKLLHDNMVAFPQLAQQVAAVDAMSIRFNGLLGICGGCCHEALAALESTGRLDQAQFTALLRDVDASLHALPPTAQVAAQQGQYLASLLQHNSFDPSIGTLHLSDKQKPFKYLHKGSLAYVGEDKAIVDAHHLNEHFVLTGREAGLLWRGYETMAQVSPRTMLLVLQNFIRTKVFGRDTSNVP
jgi:NADH:ubiquinone reductase (non-electrogenic)